VLQALTRGAKATINQVCFFPGTILLNGKSVVRGKIPRNGFMPNPDGYLFTNSKGRPYLSDNVVKYGVHRAMANLGIETPKGVHVGIHCFRHGVTSELLESGTPIHVVTRLMRHADSKVTLQHYSHIVGDAERVASEKFSRRIGQNIAQLESDPKLESTSSVKTA
jgi:integrase